MRRKDREITATDDILQIIEKAKYLHLGLFDDSFPYVVPLHYGYEFKDGNLYFFLHSAKEGHKLDLIRQNPNVCIELECDVEPVSGGEIPCKYGSTYGSVIGRGKAEILTDTNEKIRGLEMLMQHQIGRSFHIDKTMAESVEVIKISITNFTAKARV